MTFSSPPGDLRDVSRLLDAAVAAERRRSALELNSNAWRILNGVYSGTPGLALDVYAGHLVLFAYHPSLRALTPALAQPLCQALGARSLTLKDRTQKGEAGREGSQWLWGEAPEIVWAQEGALRFRIELAHPFNVGLFLDTRPVRRWLAEQGPKRVLNLFSYTCSLGLAAAAAGAATVNVDISKRYLTWGRENYQANGLSEGPESFRAMPSERFLDWAHSKGQRYDVVILDPPSFARHEGKTFALPRDYPRLAAKAAALLNPGGFLLAMTNYAAVSPETFKTWLIDALPPTVVSPSHWERIQPDPDFDVPSIWRRTEEGMLMGWRIQAQT